MILWLGLLVCLLGGCADREAAPDPLRQALRVPYYRARLAPQVTQAWERGGLAFERLRLQGRSGEWVPAVMAYPQGARVRPAPAVLCMAGASTGKEVFLQPLDLLPRWAARGFVVLAVDRPYEGERQGDVAAAVVQKGLVRVWGESIYDLVCALDYLDSRAEVDTARIGMLGLSLGGVEALLLGALDPRLKAVVCASGQLCWEETFRSGRWQQVFPGLELRQQLVRSGASGEEALKAFRQAYPGLELLDAAAVAPRLAPRPLLLMTGDQDSLVPPAAAARAFAAARWPYADAGAVDRLELWIAPGTGHAFPTAMQERALAWFKRWL